VTLNRDLFAEAWRNPFAALPPVGKHLLPVHSGKVRELFALGPRLVLVTTDRISAFDRVLGGIPFRGQVLNQLTAFWAETLADIAPTAVIAIPDPNIMVAQRLEPVMVEVVVRGYITGVTQTSLWTRYARGERVLYGHRLPDGLQKDDPLPEPLVTPTTKALEGHDEPLPSDEVVARGLLDGSAWTQVQELALHLFARGREVAAEAGLVLVDTKYEFGVDGEGRILLMDEFHTPDSSRYWQADDPTRANWDKEYVRKWLTTHGFAGEGGRPPELPEELAYQTASRYIEVLERLTGRPFEPGAYPADERVAGCLETLRADGIKAT